MLIPSDKPAVSLGIQQLSDIQSNLLSHVDCNQIARDQSNMLLNRGSGERDIMAKR
jgi:hypothetical protein